MGGNVVYESTDVLYFGAAGTIFVPDSSEERAKEMDFLEAARLRDEMFKLEETIKRLNS